MVKTSSQKVRDSCQSQLGLYQVFNLVAASLTHLLNLIPSLWRSHTVGQPMVASFVGDKRKVVGNLIEDGQLGQADDRQVGQAGSVVGKLMVRNLGNFGKPETNVSFKTTSSLVSGASNNSENMSIHEKDSER